MLQLQKSFKVAIDVRRSNVLPEVIQFVPKHELDAKRNLEDFIDLCKNKLTVFGEGLNWDSWQWKGAANFTKIGVASQGVKPDDYLASKFMGFAKAYFRYQQGNKPTVAKNELRALRAIEKALIQVTGKALIDDLSITILDEAVVTAKKGYSDNAAYHAGREIQRLAEFVSKRMLVSENLELWTNTIKRSNDRVNTGKKAKEEREKKLPDNYVLNAVAGIFASNPDDPKDIFTSSTFALLMCAPSRISEVLLLPVDCEVEMPDKNGNLQYGWRFYSGKGFGGDIKWIPAEMVPIAKEAIKRIKEITEPARVLARWIDKNPKKFYRHDKCPDVLEAHKLSSIQAANALGLVAEDICSAQSSLSGMNLKTYSCTYSLNELWNDYVSKRQPEELPWLAKEQGLQYSNALFCMTKNLLHKQRGTSPIILWAPTNNVFNNDLSPRESLVQKTHESIFDRHGYFDENGNRLKVTSHQLRHLLSTIAERGGLAKDELAKWAGRADVKQNRVYNQMSEYEMVARAEQIDPSKSLFGPVGEAKKLIPVTIQEFNTLEKGAAHVTEYGFCVHDYVISPCVKYRDCLNCSEQVCIKGEEEKLIRIKFRLVEVEAQFAAAKDAVEQGFSGADRWYEYHEHTLSHLRQLVDILESPDLPDGTQIKLQNDKSFSHINRVLKNKIDSENKLAYKATKLLGGGFG